MNHLLVFKHLSRWLRGLRARGHNQKLDQALRRVGVRRMTCDAAFTYRMGAGFAGDVNRSHPFSIEPCLQDPTTPATAYGQAVLTVAASNGVRPLTTTDTGSGGILTIWGFTVRPFPLQQQSATSSGALALGAGNTPPTNLPIDVMRQGYMVVQLNPNQAVASKGLPVFVCIAATVGSRIQNQFETATGSGNVQVGNAFFNGPADSNGLVEIIFNN